MLDVSHKEEVHSLLVMLLKRLLSTESLQLDDKLLVQTSKPDIEYLKMLFHVFFPMEERVKSVKEGR